MRLGATLAHLSSGPPFATAPWARRLVDAGSESLWTPQVIGRGTLVPDPFVTLAVAAAVTENVELGTATVQVPLHHPADLAHRVISLQAVCGDRYAEAGFDDAVVLIGPDGPAPEEVRALLP